MAELPIACALAPEDRPARGALMGSLAADGLLERRPTAAGVRFRWRDEPGIERRLREFVALERRCCGFLDFDITRGEGRLELEVRGAPEARPVIEQFFA
jgi:hypothetical protein